MLGTKWCIISMLMFGSQTGSAYKILVFPYADGFNSRLRNVLQLSDIMVKDGHNVSVIINNQVRDQVHTTAKFVEYTVPPAVLEVEDTNMSDFSNMQNFFNLMKLYTTSQKNFCKPLFANKALLDLIRTSEFDLLISDTFSLCGQLLAAYMDVKTMWYDNFLYPAWNDIYYPQFPSFTCTVPGYACTSEHMTFKEKLMNYGYYFLWNYYFKPYRFDALMEAIAEEFGCKLHTPIKDIRKGKVAVVNADYVLDTPLPFMPHVFPISGLYTKKPGPLPQDFEEIVHSSKPHGVILLSFGTLIPNFDVKKAHMFARVFGRLSQTVIWRYTGEPPKALKPNTHLVSWFPQHDLLAQEDVVLFITHCGISSTFESAFHGVPVLAMPLYGDQEINAAKLTDRAKMGVQIDYYTVSEGQFEEGILEVLSNSAYRINAKKTSSLLRDKVVSPEKELLHLVNFTIKSGGAAHLVHPYASNMSSIQFYGIDIILFLFSSVLLFTLIVFFSARFLLRFFLKLCFVSRDSKLKRS